MSIDRQQRCIRADLGFGDSSITSIHYYDELFEQLMGDLRLEEHIKQFDSRLKGLGAVEALSAFSAALLRVDRCIESRPELQSPKVLLVSAEWAESQRAASDVLAVPALQRYLDSPRGS